MSKEELLKSLEDNTFKPDDDFLKMVYGHCLYDKDFQTKFFELYTDKGFDMADYNRMVIKIEGKQEEIDKEVSEWLKQQDKIKEKKKQKDQSEDPLYKLKIGFYLIGEKGNPTKPLEDKIAQYVTDNNHVITIQNQPYIYDNGVYRLDENGKKTKALIKSMLLEKDKKNAAIKSIYQLILDNPCISFKLDEVNRYPKYVVNFKNCMLDIKKLQRKEHSPSYYSINQIPHDYNPDKSFNTTVAYEFIKEIIPDKADREMFYTYCGYCMTRETFMQKFLVIIGAPGAGKSTLLNLVTETVGQDNISSIELDQIESRFMSTFLIGKLVNICADLPKKPLESVAVIKRITGEDIIKCEIKGGAVFNAKMYIKLAFSANEMPISLDEQSDAWYRRLLMINIPKKGRHIEGLKKGLEESIPGFIALCVKMLNQLYQTKTKEIDSPNSIALVKELHHDSDSVQSWLDDCCERVTAERTETKVAYNSYEDYCNDNDFNNVVSKRTFHQRLKTKGFKVAKSGDCRYFNTLIVHEEGTKGHEEGTKFTQCALEDTPFYNEFNEKGHKGH